MKGTKKSPQAKGWETRRRIAAEDAELQRRYEEDPKFRAEMDNLLGRGGTAGSEDPTPLPPVVQPQPSHTLVGMTLINGTHRVSVGFTAPAPGAAIVIMGISEARLLAKSLLDWAQLAEDHNDGRTR